MAVTEMDVLEARITRVEEALRAIEVRMAIPEHGAPPSMALAPAAEPADSPPFDFALVGKSVLVVGGAYLLRALTETGLVPQGAGVGFGYLYSMIWILIAGRHAARGRRIPALFAASTASMIAAALIWESTARFQIVGPVLASILTLVAALTVLAIAVSRRDAAFAFVAAGLMTFTTIGLAIGTADVLPPAIAVTLFGAVAWRMQIDAYISMLVAATSDFLAMAVVVMAAVDRLPDSHAMIGLIAIAVTWILTIETTPRWPASLQTSAVTIVAAGGASLLSLQAPALVTSWAVLAVLTAAIGRISRRNQWTLQAPFWALLATAAALVSGAGIPVLLAAGAGALCGLALMPSEARSSRVILLGLVTAVALAGVDRLLREGDARVLAMQRSVVIALTAVLLSVAGRVRPDAARLVPLVLILGAFKLLIEDFRTGGAVTIALALTAYGTAMVIIARRRSPPLTLKENA